MKFVSLILSLLIACTSTPDLATEVTEAADVAGAPTKVAATPVTMPIPIMSSGMGDTIGPANVQTNSFTLGPFYSVIQVAQVPVGATVTQVSARVLDNSVVPCFLDFYDQVDFSGQTIGSSPHSAGNHTTQTLTIPLNFVATTGHNYFLVLNEVPSPVSAPCYLATAQVTFTPPL